MLGVLNGVELNPSASSNVSAVCPVPTIFSPDTPVWSREEYEAWLSRPPPTFPAWPEIMSQVGGGDGDDER